MTPIIKAEQVQFYYKDFKALSNINIEIPEKAVTAFIGPSGCGKSTLLRLFNRMNDLIDGIRLEGKILVDGEDIYDKKVEVEQLRKKVGMVFQKPNPFPKSIFDNVAYGLQVKGHTNKTEISHIVEDALKKAALWEEVRSVLDKSALQLSGGQQQRLCIARCLAINPEIILMDEPASALDPISTAKIEELIVQLKDRYTIIVVTHNMQQAVRISSHTAFFYIGELVEYDTTDNIFNQPKKLQTLNYVSGKFG